MKKNLILVSILFLLITVGCSTVQKKEMADKEVELSSQGKWVIKAFLKDLVKKKSHIIDLDVIAVYPDKMRIEATTSLGIHLASLVMSDGQVYYALTRQKKFFKGPVSDHALRPFFSFDVNPRYLMNMFFGYEIDEDNWNCEKDSQDQLEKCENSKLGLKIVWIYGGDEKEVKVIGKKFEAHLKLNLVDTKMDIKEETFNLIRPKGYKGYNLRPSRSSN